MNYIFIVNGRSDYKKRIQEALAQQLAAVKINYAIYITTGIGDGTRYVKIYCDLHPNEEVCFIACGGSGTSNEVASGIVGETNKSMAILAYGASNDFVKSYPDRKFDDLKAILKGETVEIDSIRVNDNYAINVVDFGLDSVVAEEANYQIEQGAKNPYLLGVLKGIFFGRYNRIKVKADGEKINHRWMLLCTLANGQYVGGGYKCAPNAVLDDGLIELCLLKPMSLLRFLIVFNIYKRGGHLTSKMFGKRLVYRRVKHVDVTSPTLVNACIDGELLTGTSFSIDIVPKSIRLVLPAK